MVPEGASFDDAVALECGASLVRESRLLGNHGRNSEGYEESKMSCETGPGEEVGEE